MNTIIPEGCWGDCRAETTVRTKVKTCSKPKKSARAATSSKKSARASTSSSSMKHRFPRQQRQARHAQNRFRELVFTPRPRNGYWGRVARRNQQMKLLEQKRKRNANRRHRQAK